MFESCLAVPTPFVSTSLSFVFKKAFFLSVPAKRTSVDFFLGLGIELNSELNSKFESSGVELNPELNSKFDLGFGGNFDVRILDSKLRTLEPRVQNSKFISSKPRVRTPPKTYVAVSIIGSNAPLSELC